MNTFIAQGDKDPIRAYNRANMASSFLARIGIIFTAFSAAMLSIVGLVLLVAPPSSFEGPASYLPKEGTLLLLHAETNDTVEMWGAVFPELDQIPIIQKPTDIALLEIHCEVEERSIPSPVTKAAAATVETCERGWVVFQETTDTTDATGGQILGRFTVHASSPAVLEAIKPGSDRLTQNSLVRIFVRDKTEYLFVRASALPKSTDPLEITLIQALPDDSSLLMSWNASGGTLTVEAILPLSSPVGEIVEASPESLFVLRAAGMNQLWKNLETSAAGEAQQMLEAKAVTAIQRRLGRDISFAYDVLPLLSQPFTLEERTGSGGLRFLLTGSDEDRTRTEATLGRIKSSVLMERSAIVVDERIFDDRFRSTILKRSMDDLEEETRAQEGWAITLLGTGHDGFAFATRGNQFALSDDPAWLLAQTSAPLSTLRLPGEGPALAGGKAEIPRASPDGRLFSLLFPSGENIRWALRQRGANLRLEWVHARE